MPAASQAGGSSLCRSVPPDLVDGWFDEPSLLSTDEGRGCPSVHSAAKQEPARGHQCTAQPRQGRGSGSDLTSPISARGGAAKSKSTEAQKDKTEVLSKSTKPRSPSRLPVIPGQPAAPRLQAGPRFPPTTTSSSPRTGEQHVTR